MPESVEPIDEYYATFEDEMIAASTLVGDQGTTLSPGDPWTEIDNSRHALHCVCDHCAVDANLNEFCTILPPFARSKLDVKAANALAELADDTDEVRYAVKYRAANLHQQGYSNPTYRDRDIVEEWFENDLKVGEITRKTAKKHKLSCADADPVKTCKILTPSSIYLPEESIPQQTLDLYAEYWKHAEHPMCLADYMFQKCDPSTLLPPKRRFQFATRRLDINGQKRVGYIAYRAGVFFGCTGKKLMGIAQWTASQNQRGASAK